MELYGVASGTTGENLAVGYSQGDEYMISLFVDDGVLDRGHRVAIQNKEYTKVGIAYCNGKVAIAYATDFGTTMEGEQEIERRFKSRRVGSNAEKSLLVMNVGSSCNSLPLIIAAKQTSMK